MKEKIAKLIDVKTIVTFVVVGVFAYLAIKDKIGTDNVMIVLTAIITYFFNKQKKDGEGNG